MGKPLITLPRFVDAHWARDAQLKDYMLTARGQLAFDEATAQRLEHRAAGSLFATNTRARIAFATAAERAVSQLVEDGSIDTFFFLTLAPRDFACPLADAADFDEFSVRFWALPLLLGFHHLGVIEAALYSNANVLPGTRGPMVSWHGHVLGWGSPKRKFDALVMRVNGDHEPLIPGRTAAHVRLLTPRQAVGRAIYMLKAPLNEYRVYPRKHEVVDPQTGEILELPTGAFQQKKRDLRPGDAVKMCKALGSRTLPMLVFAGGEGARLLGSIHLNALSSIVREDRAHKKKLASIISGSPRA